MNLKQINKAWENVQIATCTGRKNSNYAIDVAIVNELISWVNDFKDEEPFKEWFTENPIDVEEAE